MLRKDHLILPLQQVAENCVKQANREIFASFCGGSPGIHTHQARGLLLLLCQSSIFSNFLGHRAQWQ
jgi:hypothetical protein